MTGSSEQNAEEIVVSIDAMGGDRGPAAVIAGMARSMRKNDRIRYIVHGDTDALGAGMKRFKGLRERCDIRHAAEVIGMSERPSAAIRHARGTSMWNAIESVAEGEATVAVSCGNTGALMALSTLRLKRLAGIKRPAISILWPSRNPSGYNIMLDVGADIRADAKDLLQFAVMGVAYSKSGLDLSRPRVGLLNVGTEGHKGGTALHEAAELIEERARLTEAFEFIGYVEGTDIPSSNVDVIVTDGFTGNIALKTAEGTASQIRSFLKEAFNHTPLSRIGALFALTSLKRLSKRIDPRRVNGGVFLGLTGTVIKSHGDADAKGVSAAIKLACRLAEQKFSETLANQVASSDLEANDPQRLSASRA